MIARRRPQVPGDHAGGVPNGIPVRATTPQVHMPAEPVDWLAADAAEAGPKRIMAFPVGRGRHPEAPHQPIRFLILRFAPAAIWLLVGKPPCPSRRRAALCRERAGEPVGPYWMRSPIGIDCKPGHWRGEAAPHRMG